MDPLSTREASSSVQARVEAQRLAIAPIFSPYFAHMGEPATLNPPYFSMHRTLGYLAGILLMLAAIL
jgi:hypothetical protein